MTFTIASSRRICLATRFGAIHIRIDLERAPLSAAAVLTFVEQGWYEGAHFARAVRKDNDRGTPPIALLQARLADMFVDRMTVAHEPTSMTGIEHKDGTVSLARGAVGTGTPAGIFICVGDQPALDFGSARHIDRQGFAAFGQVVAGMDVVRKIHRLPTSPTDPDPYLAGQMLADPVAICATIESPDPMI